MVVVAMEKGWLRVHKLVATESDKLVNCTLVHMCWTEAGNNILGLSDVHVHGNIQAYRYEK